MKTLWNSCLYLMTLNILPFVNLENELSKWQEYVAKNPKISKERINELNKYLDEKLEFVRNALDNSSVDPLDLPGYNNNFITGTVYGNITLYKGSLVGISTIDRFGNVIIMYKYPMIRVHIPLGFKRISFSYKYYAELLGLSTTNLLNGTVSSCHFLFDFIINVRSISIIRNQFKINEIGEISMSLGGKYSGIVVNVLINVIKPVLLPTIKSTIEKQVGQALDSIIEFVGFAEEGIENITQTSFTLERSESLIKMKDIVQCARKGTKNEQETLLNDYIDQTLTKASQLMLNLNFDPLKIDLHPKPNETVILTKGVITGLSSVTRRGLVSVAAKRRKVQITVPAGFKKIEFKFDYEMPMSSGSIVGSVECCIFQASIRINLLYIRLRIDDFQLTNLGRVEVWLEGSTVGFTTSVILKTLQPFWEPLLYFTLQEQIQKTITNLIDVANNTTCKLLDNCDSEVDF